MSRCSQPAVLAAIALLWCCASASAETLRCQSINGNLNCAGSGGVSCQTVNGKKVCVSGHGDVVQSFGGGGSSGDAAIPDGNLGGDENMGGDESMSGDDDGMPAGPAMKEQIERHDRRGRTLLLQREGARLHLRSDWLSIDRD